VIKKIKVRAVIFDMDGVITDTMPYHFRVWAEIFKREGLLVSREDIYRREGQKGIESLREIFLEYGRPFTLKYANRLLKEKEERFKRIFKRRYILGARIFLRRLSRDGFRLALVTGTSRHEALKLLPSALVELFDVIVCGCDVQNGKPHPEPYLAALKQLKIKPAQAVVIENAPFGIRSAKAAGLRCIAIATSLPRDYLAQADFVFNSFMDLSSKLELQYYDA
jgi:beta-phosphoglucomutase